MSLRLLASLALAAAAPAMLGADDPARLDGVVLAQLTIHERIVIRIPRVAPSRLPVDARRAAPPPPIRWEEKRGPRCLPMTSVTGATIVASGSIDLLTNDGSRVRARLDGDCGALDFYSGFYLKPTRDGMACADRDAIRSRAGAACEIDEFKRLVVAKR
jgi:hypothetical protein